MKQNKDLQLQRAIPPEHVRKKCWKPICALALVLLEEPSGARSALGLLLISGLLRALSHCFIARESWLTTTNSSVQVFSVFSYESEVGLCDSPHDPAQVVSAAVEIMDREWIQVISTLHGSVHGHDPQDGCICPLPSLACRHRRCFIVSHDRDLFRVLTTTDVGNVTKGLGPGEGQGKNAVSRARCLSHCS